MAMGDGDRATKAGKAAYEERHSAQRMIHMNVVFDERTVTVQAEQFVFPRSP
jgi:hypothetical protein